jgi:flavin reductase (DIM6/NTAB) family NADH-FMN oxidoreductase RutF
MQVGTQKHHQIPRVKASAQATAQKTSENPGPSETFTPSSAPPAFDSKAFRNTVGQFASGVAVITTQGDDGERDGMTVSSFTSLSLDPPLVLFCANNGSHTMQEIEESGHFAVNVLAHDQKDICYGFASNKTEDKFAGVQTSPGKVHGDPLVAGNLATFECKLHKLTEGGDHTIVIGEVENFTKSEDDQPLIFWNGKAHTEPNLETRK